MREEFVGSYGKLPDALAFLPENRGEAYVTLSELSQPLTVHDICEALDCSQATAYRTINDFESINLVSEKVFVSPGDSPTTVYEIGVKANE